MLMDPRSICEMILHIFSREERHREQLWNAIRDGVVEMVVSDHSPCTEDLKDLSRGDFMAAWGGISSVQARYT